MATNIQSKAQVVLDGVDKSRAAFASISKSFDDVSGRVGAFTGKMGLIGGAVSGAIVALQSIKIVNVLDQLDDLQEKTGISVEKLSELRFAGESVGTPIEALANGVGKLSKQMAAAAGGNKEAKATFDALGVSVTNTDGTLRTSDAVLGDIADKFASYEDGAGKAALAQKVFGKSGADMIPLLNQGRAGIQALGEEARALGVIYTGEMARAAADFNDNLVKIKLSSEGAAVALGGNLIRNLADLSSKYLEAIKNGTVFNEVVQGMKRPANFLLNPLGTLRDAARDLNAPSAAKTTQQIQDEVNRRNPGQSLAGGGRGIIKGAAPVVVDGEGKKGSKADPLAEAKRYLEGLQKQGEKLAELTVYEQALQDIQMKRLGAISPALEQEILQTAKMVDAKKAEADVWKKFEEDAKENAAFTKKQSEERIKENDRYVEQFESGYEKLQRQLREINEAAVNNPLISQETLARANTQYWSEYLESLEKSVSKVKEVDTFTLQAAENIQAALGSNLADVLDGEFDNIGDSFVKMINRMVAEAIAADVSRYLLGDLVKGGSGEGIAGGLLKKLTGGGGPDRNPSSKLYENSFDIMDSAAKKGGGGGSDLFGGIASWFGSLFSFDVGTDFVPEDMVAKVHKGERIIPAAQNKPGFGGVTINQQFTVSGAADRRTQQQLASSAGAGAQRALARNT